MKLQLERLVVNFIVIQDSKCCFYKTHSLSKLQSTHHSFVAQSRNVPFFFIQQFLIIIPVINTVAYWHSVGRADIDFIPHSFFYHFLLDLLYSLLFSQQKDHFQRSAYKTLGSSSSLQVSVCLSVVWSTESHKSLLSWRQGASSLKLGSKSCDSHTVRAIQLLYMTDLHSDVQPLSREFNTPADSMNKQSEWAAAWCQDGGGCRGLAFFFLYSVGFLTSKVVNDHINNSRFPECVG